jgi:predicted phosphohydrolase
MKLAFTSDIHVDSSPKNAALLPILAERATHVAPDVFILAGDIAAGRDLFENTLAAFANVKCTKLIVPGNHDIWIDSKRELLRGIDSTRKYYELLPALCQRHDFIPLWTAPFRFGDVGFIGSLGWYDYSFRNPNFDDRITTQMYAEGRYGLSTWVDMRRAWWLRHPTDKLQKPRRDRLCKTDEEVCSEMIRLLTKQADELSSAGIMHIVAVVHHLPFERMVKHIEDLRWDFFSAFMGSERIGEALLGNPRVSCALCGHTHRRVDVTVGHIRAMTSPIGYTDEWGTTDIRGRIVERLHILNIDKGGASASEDGS